jgi:hypothetical protein
MPTVNFTHQNRGAVTNRITAISRARSGDMETPLIQRRLDEAYEKVFKDARVRTGYMRSTVKVQTSPGSGQISVGANYSIFIERGTIHHRAFPFFFANVRSSVQQLVADIRNLYGKGVV